MNDANMLSSMDQSKQENALMCAGCGIDMTGKAFYVGAHGNYHSMECMATHVEKMTPIEKYQAELDNYVS